MHSIYNLLTLIAQALLPFIARFNGKLKLFVAGRTDVFEQLAAKIAPQDQVFWFHVASLGEYEQGLPLMEVMKTAFPDYKIVLSFFSPSGYEVRKNNKVADVTVYLPIDTPKNAKKFIELVRPEKVFFVKYEFWPNYLFELKRKKIETYLVSGIFRENQLFFKSHGGFYKRALDTFSHFFVQNENAKLLLNKIGLSNVSVSGDTRFDRVTAILKQNNQLDFVHKFKGNKKLIVAGSTWQKDENLLVNYINQTTKDVKLIIAPHNIKTHDIHALKLSITKPTVLYSELDEEKLISAQVFILDTIGLLTKVYSAADLAYVGGGFGQPGVHNVLEPAVFSLPVIIGPNYSHFAEAVELVNAGGCLPIDNQEAFDKTINDLTEKDDFYQKTGGIAGDYVKKRSGATDKIMAYLLENKPHF